MKRVAEFLRSVIPADPFQLLFLAGIVCLVVAHGMRWWPVGVRLGSQLQLNDSFGGRDVLGRLVVLVYTWRGESVRLISARPATARETTQYEEHHEA